jgi:hypothetical protein
MTATATPLTIQKRAKRKRSGTEIASKRKSKEMGYSILLATTPSQRLHDDLMPIVLHHYMDGSDRNTSFDHQALAPELERLRLVQWKLFSCHVLGQNDWIQGSRPRAQFLSRLQLVDHQFQLHENQDRRVEIVHVYLPWMGDLIDPGRVGRSDKNQGLTLFLHVECSPTMAVDQYGAGFEVEERSWTITRGTTALFQSTNGQTTLCRLDEWRSLCVDLGLDWNEELLIPRPGQNGGCVLEDRIRQQIPLSFVLDTLAQLCSRNGMNPIAELQSYRQTVIHGWDSSNDDDPSLVLYPFFPEHSTIHVAQISEMVKEMDIFATVLVHELTKYLVEPTGLLFSYYPDYTYPKLTREKTVWEDAPRFEW